MKRVIFLFLDGVGLGANDPVVNPLAAGDFPTLRYLLDQNPPVLETGRLFTAQAAWIPTDAQLGVVGRPQSATGQAAILTGVNVPKSLGEHYGPRPDSRVRALLEAGNIFQLLNQNSRHTYFCNAYPERYFRLVESGKRLMSAIPYAATVGGQALLNHDDLVAKRALAADFTNRSWHGELGCDDVPIYRPDEAGALLWKLAQPHHFTFFEHWYTDLLGHRGRLREAVEMLAIFDEFVGGLIAVADLRNTLIMISSDHGNVEDCSHRKHTQNPVPTLLIGDQCHQYAERVQGINDFVPIILDYLEITPPTRVSLNS